MWLLRQSGRDCKSKEPISKEPVFITPKQHQLGKLTVRLSHSMAAARHNRPFIMIYGGSIKKGHSRLLNKDVNISTCYEASGALNYGKLKAASRAGEKGRTPDDVMDDLEKNACPGAGACGGMYTANTMSTAIEAMGLCLPGSSSNLAESPAKMRECAKAAEAIKICMEKNIRPRDLMTKESFENALVMLMALGGSTNGVLHLLAMAGTLLPFVSDPVNTH